MSTEKLNPKALGLAGAILGALGMLVMGILAMNGVYLEAFEIMKAWHIWFDATATGVVLGIIEAGVFSYAVLFVFAWIYNKLS